MLQLGMEAAVDLGVKSKEDRPLSRTWLDSFLERQNLKAKKPIKMSKARAKGLSQEALDSYYTKLDVSYIIPQL